jgi:hypothetical protein
MERKKKKGGGGEVECGPKEGEKKRSPILKNGEKTKKKPPRNYVLYLF